MSEIFNLENEFLELAVSSLGAELLYIRSKKGTQFLWEGSEKSWKNRAPLLFPICSNLKEDTYTHKGKTYHMAKHGFAKYKEFSGEKLSDGRLKFTLTADEETKKEYPFCFKLCVYYELLQNTLKITYCVENRGKDEMYFSIGAHEGYYCPEGIEEYYLEFESIRDLDRVVTRNGLTTFDTEQIAENSKTFPLYNDYFVGGKSIVIKNTDLNKVTLVHKNSSKRITVDFDGFSYFLLWTIPEEKYICLEPWHGMCDFEGSDFEISKKGAIITLKDGEKFETVHTITFYE